MLTEYFVLLGVAVMGLILLLATKSLGKLIAYYLLTLTVTLLIVSVWNHVLETNTFAPEDVVVFVISLFLVSVVAIKLDAWGTTFLGRGHSPTSEDLTSGE